LTEENKEPKKQVKRESALTEAKQTEKREEKESDTTRKPIKRARPITRRTSRQTQKEEKTFSPSPKQSSLDNYVQMVTKKVGKEAVIKSYINRAGEHVPTLVIRREDWFEVVQFLKTGLHFVYMQNYSGVDYQKDMEVTLHLYSFIRKERIALCTKLDREKPVVDSLTPLYDAANWNEREMYDLLGIEFTGHPNLTRILMPEDWEGHPLRKDYEPLDKEV